MAEEDENFASRWSRRKRAVAAEAAAEAHKPTPETVAAEEQVRLAEEEANRLAAEAVDLEAVKYGDDFSIFLKRGVPDILRRKALRKFFASDPLLANLDGLNDYDEDYNNPAHMVYKSAWDAARGYLNEAEETLSELGGDDGGSTEADTGKAGEAEPAPAAEQGAEEGPAEASDAAGDPLPAEEEAAPEPEAPRRVSLRRRLEG